MKTLTIVLAAGLLLAGTTLKAQNDNMALSPRKASLSAVAALEAKGDVARLHDAINEAYDNGLTTAELKEAFTHLYAYTGFPRSLNALGTLQKVISEREAAALATPAGVEDKTVLPRKFDSLKEGTKVQTSVTGRPFNYTFAPREDYFLKAHLFGDIFASEVLSHSDREILTVSAIASLPGCESQLASHSRGALNMGVTPDELRAIPSVLEKTSGSAEAWRARVAIAEALGEAAPEADPTKPENIGALKGIENSPWPVGVFNSAFAQYFDGKSYLKALDGVASNVTFEPGCRNYWHIHHKGVQVLICVAGRGWYQEWGKPAVEMTPGTVIAVPAEVRHWHGAAKDSWFQHIAYMTRVEEGASNEWLEPVDSKEYEALK